MSTTTPLELISHPLCPYVHRAASMLIEKQVPFTLRHIDLEAKPDWFLAISPRGKVPVLVVEGTSIVESLVILEYLDETTEPRTLPAASLDRAKYRMWTVLTDDVLLGHYRIAKAATPEERTAAVEAVRGVLRRFEDVLVRPFFAGEQIGIVDFAAGPGLLRDELVARELGIELYAGLPKVAAWSRRCSERPAFRERLVPDFEDRVRAIITRH